MLATQTIVPVTSMIVKVFVVLQASTVSLFISLKILYLFVHTFGDEKHKPVKVLAPCQHSLVL